MVEPFAILPSGEMKRALRNDESDYTDRGWVLAATLPTGDCGLVAVDFRFWRPGKDRGDCGEVCLQTGPGEAGVWLERWKGDGRRPRFVAARVVLAEGVESARSVVGDCAVDFRQLMIGSRDGLDAHWRVGGPLNRTNVVTTPGQAADAVRALERARIEVRAEESGRGALPTLLSFPGPLTDAEIAAADAALAPLGMKVNICEPQTAAEVDARFVAGEHSVLAAEGAPYAVMFDVGWGNGIYTWSRLEEGERALLGYECSFSPD